MRIYLDVLGYRQGDRPGIVISSDHPQMITIAATHVITEAHDCQQVNVICMHFYVPGLIPCKRTI